MYYTKKSGFNINTWQQTHFVRTKLYINQLNQQNLDEVPWVELIPLQVYILHVEQI